MGISNSKGDIGEAAFAYIATKRGYWVAKTPQDCPYDFIMDRRDGKLLRVQVKYRSLSSKGTIGLSFKRRDHTNNRGYSSESIDAFAIYIPDLDDVFLVPFSEVDGASEAFFRCSETKNNQKTKVRMINHFSDW